VPRDSRRATGGEREDPERQNPRGTEYRAARGRTLPSSCEARLIAVGVEPRGGVVQVNGCAQPEGTTRMREPKLQGKSHVIPIELVRDAWAKVKEKGGAAGPDGVTVEQFEETAEKRLYVLWNRMSSGSYFPGPVRAVEIPKKGKKGGVRVLGIPTVTAYGRGIQSIFGIARRDPSLPRVAWSGIGNPVQEAPLGWGGLRLRA